MKLAVICGPTGLETLTYWKQSYHMALAQEVLRDKIYRNWFFSRSLRGEFVMIDNGAAEGVAMTVSQILQAADHIGASEIALQDALRDKSETLKRTYMMARLVAGKMSMVIPQGRNWEEWEDCLYHMEKYIDFQTIGVAKHLEKLPGGRTKALDIIEGLGLDGAHDVHLLGCYKAPFDEALKIAKEFPWVRGLDTAAPFAYAQKGKSVTARTHYAYEWDEMPTNIDLLNKNILDMRDACMGENRHASQHNS